MSATAESIRLNANERHHELAMAAVARTAQQPEHTVGLTRNAKGDVQIEITGRAGGDLAVLAESVAGVFDALCSRYPRGEAT
jgi:hypothetical protein